MEDQRQPQAPWWQPGLILFYKLSGWVAGPILLAIFLGKFLDKKFDTAPWLFLGLTATSFIISTFAIIYTYSKELKRIEAEEKGNPTLPELSTVAKAMEDAARDKKI